MPQPPPPPQSAQAFYAQILPPRELNGGLYTGQPFAPDAAWRNFPALPDAGYMVHVNLRSADPPEEARYQFPGAMRAGNNSTVMYGTQHYTPETRDMLCAPGCGFPDGLPVAKPGERQTRQRDFSMYYYL